MSWMKVILTGDQVAAGFEMQILRDADAAFARAGIPDDAAIFTNLTQERDYTDRTVLYFSPAAASVLSGKMIAWKATPCEAPLQGEVEHFLGPGNSIKRMLAKE
jgi:hypothetical protein